MQKSVQQPQQKIVSNQGLPWFDIFMASLLVLFIVAGLFTTFLTYKAARHIVATANLPFATVATGASSSQGQGTTAGPISLPSISFGNEENEQLSIADLQEPLTILVLGVDKRDEAERTWRSDTIILVRIDPQTKSAAMLSIPRDLYVTIPDYGFGEQLNRINTAFFFGEAYDYPGGGPALVKQTIRRNFGITVDRYVVVDFDAFRKIIDLIGGIDIEVPERIVDPYYPTEDYGYMRVEFEPGLQHMDGERALIYARTRHSGSDFDRAERQQQVILAVRDKVLSFGILTSLTPRRLYQMANTVYSSIETDMTIDEMIALARLGSEIDAANIRRGIIGPNFVYDLKLEDLGDVLQPRWDKIYPYVQETLGISELLPIAPSPTPPPTPTPDPFATPTSEPVATPSVETP
ncbi:MAG: LytR family transcriptional regulator [Ardenticatenia bacterium]|nr:MAG: LytR family transcriptional regulator [Ardenticatenia bacterium]